MRTSRKWLFALPLTLAALMQVQAAWSQSGTWSSVPGSAPGARREYASIYDQVNGRYMVFSGMTGSFGSGFYDLNEVWMLTLGVTPTWSLSSTVGTPPGPRHGAQFGYDPARNRLLVFGGYGQHYTGDPLAWLNDVWQLSLDGPFTWTELHPSGTPPQGRLAGAACYDLFRQRFVGFGGLAGVPVDTWQLDLSGDPAWVTMETGLVKPPGGYGMASVYDPDRDRLITFGGSINDNYFGAKNDVWELNLRANPVVWHQMQINGALPRARRSGAAIHDPLRDRLVIFGGWDATSDAPSTFLNDTWALSLSGQPLWTQLAPSGSTPVGRDAMTAIYDPLGDRLVVFGGWGVNVMLGDTQFLSWGDQGQAASVTHSAQADPVSATVQWNVNNATSPYNAVYRREDNGPWTSIATVDADGSGNVTYVDHAVKSGSHYGYLLAVPSERGCDFTGEAHVDVPSVTAVDPSVSADFALGHVLPNPVAERFSVTFALASADPARLEMLDIAGRRILSREVGSMGAGPHMIEMSRPRDVSPGLYLLRLTQGGRSATSRLVINR